MQIQDKYTCVYTRLLHFPLTLTKAALSQKNEAPVTLRKKAAQIIYFLSHHSYMIYSELGLSALGVPSKRDSVRKWAMV